MKKSLLLASLIGSGTASAADSYLLNAFAATFLSYHTVAYWLAGAVLFLVSMAVSLHFFRSNTDLMQHVSSRFLRRFHHEQQD